MSMTFTKLFSSITESTIWCEDTDTRIVWITMLAMSDRKGRVWGSVPGIANRARVSVESARKAIDKFLGPDPDSRSNVRDPDSEGRRLRVIDGGWELINHRYYRAIRDEEERRAYKAEHEAKRRAAKRGQKRPTWTDVDSGGHNADADADARKIITSSSEQKDSSDEQSVSLSRTPSQEAGRLAQLLKSEILRNKPDYRITQAQLRKWTSTADLMLRRDARTEDQIASLIRWVQSDEFWKCNILSMDTLRKKFDQLELKRESTHGNSSSFKTWQSPEDITRAAIERVAADQRRAAENECAIRQNDEPGANSTVA